MRADQEIFRDDIAWVRRTIKDLAPNMPVLLKGVGCVADVELAKEYGADGILLSNHGVSSDVCLPTSPFTD